MLKYLVILSVILPLIGSSAPNEEFRQSLNILHEVADQGTELSKLLIKEIKSIPKNKNRYYFEREDAIDELMSKIDQVTNGALSELPDSEKAAIRAELSQIVENSIYGICDDKEAFKETYIKLMTLAMKAAGRAVGARYGVPDIGEKVGEYIGAKMGEATWEYTYKAACR